jgi:hypothetical protein
MPGPTAADRSRHALRRAARVVALASCVVTLGGCSTLRATFRGYERGPDGIMRVQHRLRDALARGDFPTALAWREDDALLRALTRATSAYYASQFLRAGTLLDSAALMADDRITESLSRDALALLTSDNARHYRPRPTERLFIAYYGMLSYARLERWEDAAVEARRMVSLLAQRESDRDAEERPLHGALGYLAGAVFERAGRTGEADVAYRAAHRLLANVPERPARTVKGEGEVLVVLERGFVAHRVTEQINVYFGEDSDSLRHGSRRRHDGDSRIGESIGRVLGPGRDDAGDAGDDDDEDEETASAIARDSSGSRRRARRHDDDGYWLAVALPVLRRSARPLGIGVRLASNDGRGESVTIATVLDEAAAVDERRDRVAVLARAVARASAKYAVAKAVKDSKGDGAGKLANIGVSLLERADLRSWHLLPQEVQLLRVSLPAGPHTLQLEVGDGAASRVVEIGPVTVRAGTLTIVPHRLWRDVAPVPLVAAR